jgi:excisionase family DNA binding protein
LPNREVEKLLSPKEVGEVLGLRRSKIQQMLACGEVPSVIVSMGDRRRVFRVRPSDLERWLKAREVSGYGRI